MDAGNRLISVFQDTRGLRTSFIMRAQCAYRTRMTAYFAVRSLRKEVIVWTQSDLHFMNHAYSKHTGKKMNCMQSIP